MKLLYLSHLIVLMLIIGFSACSISNSQEVVPGGISSHDIPATAEIRQLVQGIHTQIKTHLMGVPGGANIIGKIRPISYRTQLVNGINYFIKVRANTPKKSVYYHLRIYKSFEGAVRLLKVDGPKRPGDSITFF